jgi:cyclopropane fatty-acyl-phospholipid synthase-like methyltransferase
MLGRISHRIYSLLHGKNSLNNQIPKHDVNIYYSRQLSEVEIKSGEHRVFVGGLWKELGILQFEFMKKIGLLPEHKLLDVGCGAMRGGLYFVDYLDTGNYYGLDINNSLIEAAKIELVAAGLESKSPHLLVDDRFNFSLFDTEFDYALAVSVFTHLDTKRILSCLINMQKNLKSGGKFYATFFEAPDSVHLNAIEHNPGGVVTNYDSDPFHYSYSEMEYLAEQAGLKAESVKDWLHPRDQKMLCFVKAI